MCKEKKRVMWMYIVLQNRLRESVDPWGSIGWKSIQMILCRLCHVPKVHSYKVLHELEELKIIEPLGRNKEGVFYKVN